MPPTIGPSETVDRAESAEASQPLTVIVNWLSTMRR
jgi:hypothetical protein